NRCTGAMTSTRSHAGKFAPRDQAASLARDIGGGYGGEVERTSINCGLFTSPIQQSSILRGSRLAIDLSKLPPEDTGAPDGRGTNPAPEASPFEGLTAARIA